MLISVKWVVKCLNNIKGEPCMKSFSKLTLTVLLLCSAVRAENVVTETLDDAAQNTKAAIIQTLRLVAANYTGGKIRDNVALVKQIENLFKFAENDFTKKHGITAKVSQLACGVGAFSVINLLLKKTEVTRTLDEDAPFFSKWLHRLLSFRSEK